MGKKRNREFWESANRNNSTYFQYLDRLTELSVSMFEWKNLPESVDVRFLELALFREGQAVFFKEDGIDEYIALKNMSQGNFNIYGIPKKRMAFGYNGYRKSLTDKDSVIIYNNYMHTDSYRDVRNFAQRLYNLDRAIDVNANAQKTPILIRCDDEQKLTMQNLYMQYDGNMPVIMGTKAINGDTLNVLKTDAPYVADKLYQLKTQIWNEALTYLGISNININKKERLITDEVIRNQGGTIASRYSRLEARREACKKINTMFGLNIWCDYREDYNPLIESENELENEVVVNE